MQNFIKKAFQVALVAGALATAGTASAAELSGAGASFPYPIYAKWAEAYKAKTGTALNYQSIGSGGGIKQIKAKTVDFGASDAPLKPEELKEAGLVQFPAIVGGIVPVVNVAGLKPGELKLTGAVLADIFLGKVTTWNDVQITTLNPGLELPSGAISVVRRSDGSGTTFNFTDYLAKQSPKWKSDVGVNTAVEWPVGVGGKGNEGVAAMVGQTQGSIGYVEYAYAKQNKLTHVLVQNHAGKYVEPNNASFQAAAATADWSKAPGFYLILTDAPGEKAWPIAASSFILLHAKSDKPAQTAEVLKFFDWSFKNGAKLAEELDYVALPDNLVKLIADSWKQIQGSDNQPVWKS
ncbi:phosphate ABC transporter substrate-binding protein PstS [Roseiterribacter gracilis]|uniref:Phosphate-binding protein PstS n=1 Tax=Roseiterribacter gracilis TaxID=2812848 RepID=A0A8S8X9R3_9PROT|nr:phosphate-binding protein PstS [Rhodospirillales bacterium TMPK1]